MLKKYEVTNFKSFKNKTVFDVEKTNYQMLSTTNVQDSLLKGLMFVGANASGKSNSVLAIKFLLDSLFDKRNMNIAQYQCIFSGNPIMSLAYTFDVEGTEILYEVEYQNLDEKITEELYVGGQHLLSRDGKVARVWLYGEKIYKDIPANILFLRDVYFNTKFRDWEVLQKWFEFLSNSIYVDLYTQQAFQYKSLDLSLKSYIEKDGTDEINLFFEEFKFNQTIEYDKEAKGHYFAVESYEKEIFFKRKGIEEPIPYEWESLGNQNLLQLLPAFFYCLKYGGLLLLDEFSSGFHNDLEELLVRYFMKKSKNAQLVFVSHSTNLLSNSILRPDQIYSVDFGEQGSVIKRFSSEKPREAQNLEKMYLSGVFNGVPNYEYKIK